MGASGYLKICCFKLFFYVHPDPLGWKIQLDEDILQIGFVQEPTSYVEYTLARRSTTHMSRCICHLFTTGRFRFPWFLLGSGNSWILTKLPWKESVSPSNWYFWSTLGTSNFPNKNVPLKVTSVGWVFQLTNEGRQFQIVIFNRSLLETAWPSQFGLQKSA